VTALALRSEHGQELAPACDQGGQVLLLDICERADEACQVVAAREDGRQFGQGARVDAVGLGQAPHRLGKVARLLGIYYRHRQAGGLQRAGHGRFVASSGLHHHQRPTGRLQRQNERCMPLGIVVKALGAKLGAEAATSRCALATSMPTTTEEPDMAFVSLACACALDGARNRSGSMKTSAVSVRGLLSNGLKGPSAYQAARAGLAASSAPRPYRAGLV
jgi:hypothetical protein